jgi:hypothetical protein
VTAVAEDEKPGPLSRLWPFGAAILILVSEFPPPPKVLLGQSEKLFKGIAAAGLLIGLVFGLYTANKRGYLQPKRKGLLIIGLFAAVFLTVTARYFQIVVDTENHYYETVVEFFVINILSGFLLFLVGPAIRLMKGTFGGDE